MVEKQFGALSIAGFDPSGGAGVLADIKTFEANKIVGMGIVSCITFQNDIEFDDLRWLETEEILNQISTLQRRFEWKSVKIGLVKDLETLNAIIIVVSTSQIVWDPIISASAGFEFHKKIDKEQLIMVLKKINLITPNTNEIKFLTGISNPTEAAKELSKYCNVLLKGGHSDQERGTDYLFTQNNVEKIMPSEKKDIFPKHGSGCVLSAAIVANLVKGFNLSSVCQNAKKYVEQFLSSNSTLLGTHYE